MSASLLRSGGGAALRSSSFLLAARPPPSSTSTVAAGVSFLRSYSPPASARSAFLYEPSLYAVPNPVQVPGVPEGRDPNAYVRARPTNMGLGDRFLWWLRDRLRDDVIHNTRFIVGQASDGLVRNQDFFYKECKLPNTVQAYYQIHLLMMMIYLPRLRALPTQEISKKYMSEALGHFFPLMETRLQRTVGAKIPNRMVKGWVADLQNQFQGTFVSFERALAGPDVELGTHVWRNIFGARGIEDGLSGFAVPQGKVSKRVVGSFRVGEEDGTGRKLTAEDLIPSLEGEGRIGPLPTDTDSPASLNDIPEGWEPLQMVEQVNELVGFIRREIKRLEGLPDEMVLQGYVGAIGPVREADCVLWDELMREKAALVLEGKPEGWLHPRRYALA